MLYDEHVVDIVYSRWPSARRPGAISSLYFVFFYPSVFMVMIATWPFVRDSYGSSRARPSGIVPFLLKSVIIVGFGLLTLRPSRRPSRTSSGPWGGRSAKCTSPRSTRTC
jgi:TRAP-type mannitol/chloroaromatic compound transport system permease small subunit